MTTPRLLLRFAFVAATCQLAAACAINPFDGDPGGPPRTAMWDGAYGGDNPDTSSDGPYRPRASAPAEDDQGLPDAPVSKGSRSVQTSELPPAGSTPSSYEPPSPRELPPVPAAAPSQGEELPPPGEYRSVAEEGSGSDGDVAAPMPAPSPAPTPRRSGGSGERTLSTKKGVAAADPVIEEPKAPSKPEVAEAKPDPKPSKSHTVTKGEQLADIADQYGAREVDIISANNLKPPYALKAGQKLKIPTRQSAAAKPGDLVVAGTPANVPAPREKPSMSGKKKDEPTTKVAAVEEDSSAQFEWPVTGKVVSGFGAGGDGLYNEGINIAVPVGTPVRAAAGGTVRYAGNELRGYGNLVLIEHEGGYITAYAHNDSLKVKRGDKITRGQVIASSGQTGNVKSPQLHFEIRKGKESVDPRKYLVAMN